MTLRRGARWLSWQQEWRVLVAVEWDVCWLTVNFWACPLSSGMFVGGADGVSDCRQRLKQREWSRQRCSDKAQVCNVVPTAAWHNHDFYFQEDSEAELSFFSALQLCTTTLLCIPRVVCCVCSLQGSFHSLQPTVLLPSGAEKHNDLLKSHWYHLFGSHTNMTLILVGIMVLLETGERGRERAISYCDIIETVCAIKLVQRCWINKGLVLIFEFLQLKHVISIYFHFCGPECDFKTGVTSRSSSSTSLYGWWVSGLFTLSRRSTASRQVKPVWATNTCYHKPHESLLW